MPVCYNNFGQVCSCFIGLVFVSSICIIYRPNSFLAVKLNEKSELVCCTVEMSFVAIRSYAAANVWSIKLCYCLLLKCVLVNIVHIFKPRTSYWTGYACPTLVKNSMNNKGTTVHGYCWKLLCFAALVLVHDHADAEISRCAPKWARVRCGGTNA